MNVFFAKSASNGYQAISTQDEQYPEDLLETSTLKHQNNQLQSRLLVISGLAVLLGTGLVLSLTSAPYSASTPNTFLGHSKSEFSLCVTQATNPCSVYRSNSGEKLYCNWHADEYSGLSCAQSVGSDGTCRCLTESSSNNNGKKNKLRSNKGDEDFNFPPWKDLDFGKPNKDKRDDPWQDSFWWKASSPASNGEGVNQVKEDKQDVPPWAQWIPSEYRDKIDFKHQEKKEKEEKEEKEQKKHELSLTLDELKAKRDADNEKLQVDYDLYKERTGKNKDGYQRQKEKDEDFLTQNRERYESDKAKGKGKATEREKERYEREKERGEENLERDEEKYKEIKKRIEEDYERERDRDIEVVKRDDEKIKEEEKRLKKTKDVDDKKTSDKKKDQKTKKDDGKVDGKDDGDVESDKKESKDEVPSVEPDIPLGDPVTGDPVTGDPVTGDPNAGQTTATTVESSPNESDAAVDATVVGGEKAAEGEQPGAVEGETTVEDTEKEETTTDVPVAAPTNEETVIDTLDPATVAETNTTPAEATAPTTAEEVKEETTQVAHKVRKARTSKSTTTEDQSTTTAATTEVVGTAATSTVRHTKQLPSKAGGVPSKVTEETNGNGDSFPHKEAAKAVEADSEKGVAGSTTRLGPQ